MEREGEGVRERGSDQTPVVLHMVATGYMYLLWALCQRIKLLRISSRDNELTCSLGKRNYSHNYVS